MARLVDLEPSWLVTEAGRHGMGVGFGCPHCNGAQGLGVWFANPLDGGSPAGPEHDPAPRWQRSGETFDTLTLTPSIDASKSGHWHGWIKDGEVR